MIGGWKTLTGAGLAAAYAFISHLSVNIDPEILKAAEGLLAAGAAFFGLVGLGHKVEKLGSYLAKVIVAVNKIKK